MQRHKEFRSTHFLYSELVSGLESALLPLCFSTRNTTYDKVSKQDNNSYFANSWNIYGRPLFDSWIKILNYVNTVASIGTSTYFGT